MTKNASKRWRAILGAVVLFAGVGVGTARVFAVTCAYTCGSCHIVYVDCGACGGDDCEGVGFSCTKVCWDCGSGQECAPVT